MFVTYENDLLSEDLSAIDRLQNKIGLKGFVAPEMGSVSANHAYNINT